MFISVLDLFKVGIGPSSSHTMGPMVAAFDFITQLNQQTDLIKNLNQASIRCILKGSLAFTGKGHSTDHAIILGLNGYTPNMLKNKNIPQFIEFLNIKQSIQINASQTVLFHHKDDIIFDTSDSLPEHPNGMIFELYHDQTILFSETYFSIGGGFITTRGQINQVEAPLKMIPSKPCKYPFNCANSMLQMAKDAALPISSMKWQNELNYTCESDLIIGIDTIWESMKSCLEKGLLTSGVLPGGLNISRRAQKLHNSLQKNPNNATINDWLCAYAMAVNEENAAGNMVVTAPTNGAAGVIPAVLYYLVVHQKGKLNQIRNFLLTASAIGGLIKHNSSISGAEVGCQGEVGSASAMAAAGLCEVLGGTPEQVENAAEIALEHHLGMTCDPVKGLVQVPCIERNGFGAIKAYSAASLALKGDGQHFMSLDRCIHAMKQTGLEMSHKYKETALGGLAVSITEC